AVFAVISTDSHRRASTAHSRAVIRFPSTTEVVALRKRTPTSWPASSLQAMRWSVPPVTSIAAPADDLAWRGATTDRSTVSALAPAATIRAATQERTAAPSAVTVTAPSIEHPTAD